ncbi:phosphatidylinositol 4,5-bisphosphate 3-kinase catalytic subunit gamma isoform [Centroberyx affinis]|uniref:phosphatidylinositol 4,5-bisphosphate 3-kinase catalytic subunit gamma isoform n=1 Tax=Centroberyx affinis TaxID=166261 RepID=UPI003A5C6123
MDSVVFLDQTGRQEAADFPSRASFPSCSENSLLFVCEFHPGPGPTQASSEEDFVGIGLDYESVAVILPAQCSVYQLRLRVCMQAQEQSCHPDPLAILDPEKYILLYDRGEDWYEAYDDCQVIRTLDIPWSRDASGRLMARIVVTPPLAVDSEERQKQQQALAYLIGHDLDKEASDRLGELTFTRRKLASPRRQELKNRDDEFYATEPWTTSAPMPNDLQSHLNRKLSVTLHHLNQISFSVKVDFTTTPQVLLKVFRRVLADQGFNCDSSDSLVLKVSGREEFLSRDFPLSEFLWVRQCMKTNQDLHLSVVPVAQLPDEAVRVVDWPLVDSFTGQFSSHEDLCLEGKDLDDIFMMSLWDCNRRFRVKLLGFDIPKLPSKPPQSAYVEASILYGNKVLSSVSSVPKAFTDEVLWNEWLEFEILLSDLPRGAKLGLTINASGTDSVPVTRESKYSSSSSTVNKAPDQHKGKGKVLYFVNLLLIDHRSILSQGPHTLHMWSYPELEDEAFTYHADKLSSATNPDIADSMAISFLLDRYSFPVVLPNSSTPSEPCQSSPSSGQFTTSSHCSFPVAPSSSYDPGQDASSSPPSTSSTVSPPSPDTRLSAFRPELRRANTIASPGRSSPSPISLSPSAPLYHSSTLDWPAVNMSPSPSHVPALPPKRNSYSCNPTSTLSSTQATASSPSPTSPSSTSSNTSPSSLSVPLPAKPTQGASPDAPTLKSPSPVFSTDRARLRRFREESVRYASNLPQFLRSVDWMKRSVVEDVHWLLGHWDAGELDLSVALELLSVDFADERVRRLAVQRLESLSNDEVLKYLLQLVQTLKVEPYHDSFLAQYLIRRALRSKRIGHFFFWYVRSEVAGCPYFRQRMAVVLEAYLLGCGQTMLDGFSQQVQAVEALHEVACLVKKLYPDKTDLPPTAALRLQELLKNCNLPNEFLVPFDPRIRVGRIMLDRCKVMASKKKPLWLEFCPMSSPTSASPVGIIFKQGDDLRQDMLVIQTLVVMDSIWQEKSLDLNLIPYGCISTGHNIGMIEIVRNAMTIAAVQRSQGGTTGAFRNDALFDWLKNKCPLQEIHYKAVERFVNSCAGYCVATYVLGIGDRHNDNIMITDQGNLFHIDFGHILGNRKRFLGVSRERVPFVLTPDFLYVMGRVRGRTSLYFQRFRDTCTQAYLSLRSHSRLLVTLFSLMLLTGIPELSAAEDMRYLREALQEERGETEAREHFLQQISVCEQLGWTVQANWWIHMVAGIK